MIFVHEFTWDETAQKDQFADYIPLDPQLYGVEPLPLLTVLIHELNVNSFEFLYQDTHLAQEDIQRARQNGASPSSYFFMGRQPLLALVYLDLVLNSTP